MITTLGIFLVCIASPIVKFVTCTEIFENLVDKRCLNCFCQAQSNCQLDYDCNNKTLYVCGPYKLSEGYWIDGGKPGNTNPDTEFADFVACSKNKLCAEDAIEHYMRLYKRDCNKNGVVDCVDYFRIHLGGPGVCTSNDFENTAAWLKFIECYLNTAPNSEEAFMSVGGIIRTNYSIDANKNII